ncbi:ABC transporter permease [Geminicoccus harenae]|uniref:ABC transporter permease n=1 Tax=Geminicoccus harenae TaxID=2498453 RepID=UPI001CC2D64A|nr:ABC transporter permease [Geminicoccus harenae]
MRRLSGRALSLIASVVLTVFGLLVVTFFIGRVMPVDPLLAVVGDRAPEHVRAQAATELGLDLPLWRQFLRYLGEILQGDFGNSVLSGQPVLTDIARFFPATLELATAATLIGVCLGVPLGVLAATRHGQWPDQVIRVVALAGYSVPVFWLGLVGLLVFYAELGWVAGPGRIDVVYEYTIEPVIGLMLVDTLLAGDGAAFLDAFWHLVLPASVLGYLSLAYITRMTRSLMLAELGQEYVIAARVKGLPERLVIWRHVLGNIMVPLITTIALSYAYLLEGAVLTETVFAWPGLGLYITQSLFSADLTAVLGATIVIGLVFIGLNLLSDLLYTLVDPRAR